MKKAILNVAVACLKAALAVGIFVLCNILAMHILRKSGVDLDVYAGATEILSGGLSLLALILFWRMDRSLTGEYIDLRKPKASLTLCSVITALGLTGLVYIYLMAADYLSDYINSLKDNMDEYREVVNRYSQVPQKQVPLWDSIVYILSLFTLVPVLEEFLFRGIVMGQMKKIAPGWAAVLIQAVVFALLHGISIHIGYALICGIVLGAVCMLCENLWMSVTVHAVFNLLGSALPTFLSLEQLGIPKNVQTDVSYVLTLSEYFLMFPAALAFVFIWYRHKKMKEEEKKKAMVLAEGSPEESLC